MFHSVFEFLGPVYTTRQRQCCDDASDAVLIESNGVGPKWVAIPFWRDCIVFNEKSITSVIAVASVEALTLTPGVNGPLGRRTSFIRPIDTHSLRGRSQSNTVYIYAIRFCIA